MGNANTKSHCGINCLLISKSQVRILNGVPKKSPILQDLSILEAFLFSAVISKYSQILRKNVR